MNAERLAEIERRLADLGNVEGWHDMITDEGDLALCLPSQFHWEDDQIILGNLEDSTQADHALLEFLGDAPHAIRELAAAVHRYRAALDQVIKACVACDDGYIEYSPLGLDAWLPTGDPNIITEPCPYCGPAHKALGLEEHANV